MSTSTHSSANKSTKELCQQLVSQRRNHPAWMLLASRNAPLTLACLKQLMDSHPDGIELEDTIEELSQMFGQYSRLVTSLLDVRFDGEVSRLGLETFLGAFVEGSHWLLVVDLDGSLLPFPRQRVASSDLPDVHLPGARLLIVENETCYHQLPELPETIAILGTGFDLDWTASAGFKNKLVGYWGDIDTWGLQFLAKARSNLPHIKALMMSEQIYDAHHRQAVAEPVVAGTDVPDGLLEDERKLYHRLLKEPVGRLEQEFVPSDVVCASLNKWAGPQI